MGISDSVGWDVDRNFDANIAGDIAGGLYSGVDVEVEREGYEEIKL